MNKTTKIILVTISIIMILVAIGIIVSKSVPPTSSAGSINVDFSDKTVDSLRFTNANLVGNQFTVLVQNTTSAEYNLKSITVKFLDQDNNEIKSIDAYIGSNFNANEIRNLDVKTDADLSNLRSVTYIVNR